MIGSVQFVERNEKWSEWFEAVSAGGCRTGNAIVVWR